jgi:hypothetical protein
MFGTEESVLQEQVNDRVRLPLAGKHSADRTPGDSFHLVCRRHGGMQTTD